jgi:hypothetical protein
MAKKVTCIITGKSFNFNNDFYQKKVNEFGSETELQRKYVCRQAAGLLNRGYSVDEIRDLLKVDKKMAAIDESLVAELKNLNENDDLARLENMSIKKSDPDVAAFIENIKKCNI